MQKMLQISLYSFGYRRSGIPKDNSEHGGGFVFDCRSLPNPGRLQQYQQQTGKENSVCEWLETHPETAVFLKSCTDLVEQSVVAYHQRNFTNLMISFGCTGGQHRSVYMAEHLKTLLDCKADTITTLTHLEESYWPSK